MKASLRPEMTEGRLIRDVGPKKMMTLVSFRLTEEMIDRSNKREKDSEGSCEEGKRVKVWIVCLEKLMGRRRRGYQHDSGEAETLYEGCSIRL